MHDRAVEWREQLVDSIRRARESAGVEDVRVVLERALSELGEAGGLERVEPLMPPVAVLGVVGCAAGWVGVLVRPDGRTTLHVASGIVAMVEHIREEMALGIVAIDTGPSAQTPLPKLLEFEEWVRSRPSVEVIEVRAESSFAQMNADPLRPENGSAEDAAVRREVLRRAGMMVPPMFSGMGFEEDDLLNACEVACAAIRAWA